MTTRFVALRRDVRHPITPGCGTIEFTEPQTMRPVFGLLTCLSASGLGFQIVTDGLNIEAGAVLGACKLRVGHRTIHGDFVLRNRQTTEGRSVEHGGLFYPSSVDDESQVHACVESLKRGGSQEAVREDPGATEAGAGASLRGLYLRCGGCHRANWIGCRAKRVICACGEYLGLGQFADPDSWDQLADLARQLAWQGGIDLPAGYAIVAGLMTLEHATELGHGSSPACSGNSTASSDAPSEAETPGRVRYDPAFEPAVSAGLLTPIQAFERGSRKSFAEAIVARHALDHEQAYAVTDNRVSLLVAIRASRGVAVTPLPSIPEAGGRRPWIAVVGVLLLALVAVLTGTNDRWTAAAAPETLPDLIPGERADRTTTDRTTADRSARLRSATTVERNRNGQVAHVIGPDPRSVLLASCEALSESTRFDAVEVTSAFPPAADARLGIVRGIADRRLFVMPIRRDPSSRRWYAGDGIRPVGPDGPVRRDP